MNIQPTQQQNNRVNFSAMKKSQFKGIDFAVVEKFKAPIEKFDTISDLHKWAESKCNRIVNADYGGRTIDVKFDRICQINDWDSYLNDPKLYSSTEQLVILNGITRGLKPKNETICPVFNKQVLDKTLTGIKSELSKDKEYQFNFGQMYRTNLREMYSKLGETDPDSTKWIVIPSKRNDPEHFEENIKKLQSLSCHEWCTKYGGAKMYLNDGDIHIYLENGNPKLVIRFDEDIIKEVNSEHNDYIIPDKYLKMMNDYIKDNDYLTTERVDNILAPLGGKPQSVIDTIEPISFNFNIFSRIKQVFKTLFS